MLSNKPGTRAPLLASHRPENEATALFAADLACPMSGDPVLPHAFFTHERQRVHFCCTSCAIKGSQQPALWLGKSYPTTERLEACACEQQNESPERKRTFQGYELSFCSVDCEDSFFEDPQLMK